MKAMEMALNNRTTSVTAEIERQGGDASEVFKQIAADEEEMAKLGFQRLTSVQPQIEADPGEGETPTPKKKAAPAKE